MNLSSPFPDFGRRTSELDDSTALPVTCGFGTLLHREHQLHAAIGSGIRCAKSLRAVNMVRILRDHASKVAAIVVALGHQYRMLPRPGRFLAIGANISPATRVTRHADAGNADPLVQLSVLHEELIRRIEGLVERERRRSAPTVFSEALHEHRTMVWRLGTLLNGREPLVDAGPPGGRDSQGGLHREQT